MKIIKFVSTFFFVLSFLSSFAKAQTERLDNLAACAGVVIGNGAVDFYLGDEHLLKLIYSSTLKHLQKDLVLKFF